jgi:hypothetical protein
MRTIGAYRGVRIGEKSLVCQPNEQRALANRGIADDNEPGWVSEHSTSINMSLKPTLVHSPKRSGRRQTWLQRGMDSEFRLAA